MNKYSDYNPAKYFAEIQEHELLGREGEIALAKQIEYWEIELWRRLLSFEPAQAVILETLERENMDLSALEKEASVLAPYIRQHDRDRIHLAAVMEALDTAPRKGRGRAKWRRSVDSAAESAAAARQRFVSANLRLVIAMSRKFSGYGVPMDDLIQEGNIGLIKGVDRFEYRQGYRFSTYAGWWIRHAMGRIVANNSRTVRVPVHVQEENQRIVRAQREISAKLGRDATLQEIAERCDISVARVRKIRSRARANTVSLDEPMGEDGTTRLDLLVAPANDERSAMKGIFEKQEAAQVQELLDTLTHMQADVLRKRFGLDGYAPMTLRTIGEEYGLSRERIRQIQGAALQALRATLEAQEDELGLATASR